MWGRTIKNIFYGKEHIKIKHPNEFWIKQDFQNFLIKNEKKFSEIPTKTPIDEFKIENLSNNTIWNDCDNQDFKTVYSLKMHKFIHIRKWYQQQSNIYVEWDNKKFDSLRALKVHRLWVHNIDIRVCKICRIVIRNLKFGRLHLKRWHTEEYGNNKDLEDLLPK